ncbi:ATP-grasp domain-containing protein [Marinifilum sp. RC60d5]|uniref:ATP-grasp domain-containing protein n=1 Tax=Marinifilum sp. RC60d5 TaxID=3458414 RepID=UPI0040367EC7
MKIAIHHRSGSFSDRWINYCEEKQIAYTIVDAYDTDIVEKVKDCDAFMWHHHHADYRDTLFAKQLLYSLQMAGKKVFPDFNTGWHFDDKVGQKYMFEAIGAPLVPSFVFYTKRESLEWIEHTSFPKVFKLRGGAGAVNVKLVRTKLEAIKLINRAFGRGFPQFDKWNNLKERWTKFKGGKDTFLAVCKGIGRLFINTEFGKMRSPEKGYVYFQDFIPNNGFDIRVVVVGDKAVALQRNIRENDFRASGSGDLVFPNENIDKDFISLAYKLNKKLGAQSTAFDFIKDLDNNIYLVEISYGFPMLNFLDKASGYWDENLSWNEGKFIPQNWMVDNLIR